MKKMEQNKFKKNSLISICLVLFAVFICLFTTNEVNAKAREKVNISYYNDSGFYVLDKNEKLVGGYAYDLQVVLNRYLNWDTNYVYGVWKECLERVKTGETDLVFGVFKTPERQKDYAFTKEPIAIVTNYICGRSDEEFLNDDYTKLRGKRFGLTRGAISSDEVKKFLDEKNIKVTYVITSSSKESKKLLADNKIDYFIINNNVVKDNEKILQKFSSTPRYIMATKDKKFLMEEFDSAIKKMRVKNPGLIKSVLAKSYKSKVVNISDLINADERNFIKTAKEIRCGVVENNAPYYYKNNQGKVEGIVKVVTDKIQKDSGLKFTLIPFANAKEEIKALKENEIDAIGMIASNLSNGQKYSLNLSKPYIDSDVAILKSKVKIKDKTIKDLYAIVKSPFGYEHELNFELPNVRFKNYETIQDCIEALNKGDVGAAIIADFNAKINNKEINNTDNLVSYFANGISFKQCIGFSNKLDVRYLEITDKVIENLDSSDIKMAVINTVNNSYEKNSFELFFNKYKIQILVILAFIIIILAYLYFEFLKVERAKLRIGHERFKKASKQAQVSYFEYNYEDKKMTFFDDTWIKRHGVEQSIIENYDVEKRKHYLDKESREKIFNALKIMEREDEKEIRINARGIDDKRYYYLIKMSAIRDESKKLVKALGSILDVTNTQKLLNRYENEVKRNEVMGAMLLASFMVNITKSEIIANSNCLIAKKDEIIGMTYDEFFTTYLGLVETKRQKSNFKKVYLREHLIEAFNEGRRDFSSVVRLNYYGKFNWVEIASHVMQDPFTKDLIGVIYIRDAKEREILQSALDLAEAANDAKSNFLSSVSHEIRTPMNAIMGLTDMAIEEVDQNKEKDSKIYNALSNIKLSSKYLLDIINDILEMSRIESGKTQLNKAVFDSYAFIKTVKTIILTQAREKNIEFSYTPDENLKRYYIGDEVKLKKVFINILGNAIKFTPKNGKVKYTSKIISCNNKRTIIKIIIEDTGIGISEKFLQHIFEPFSREDGNETKYQGTGLGMAISKNFIKMMDGDIKIESKVGKGTAVRMTFAVENYDESKLDSAKGNEDVLEIEKAKVKQSFKGFKILLVEDNKLNALIAKHLLAKMGFEIETAINGKIAIDRFSEKPKDYYFAILMDIRMPIMGGIEATKCIRKLERKDAKTIPIVAMTANAFDTDRINSLDAGMNEHITKPIDLDKLTEVLSRFSKN